MSGEIVSPFFNRQRFPRRQLWYFFDEFCNHGCWRGTRRLGGELRRKTMTRLLVREGYIEREEYIPGHYVLTKLGMRKIMMMDQAIMRKYICNNDPFKFVHAHLLIARYNNSLLSEFIWVKTKLKRPEFIWVKKKLGVTPHQAPTPLPTNEWRINNDCLFCEEGNTTGFKFYYVEENDYPLFKLKWE